MGYELEKIMMLPCVPTPEDTAAVLELLGAEEAIIETIRVHPETLGYQAFQKAYEALSELGQQAQITLVTLLASELRKQ
jgi:hypothetical protein